MRRAREPSRRHPLYSAQCRDPAAESQAKAALGASLGHCVAGPGAGCRAPLPSADSSRRRPIGPLLYLACHLLESRLSEFGRQSRFAADEQRTHMSLWLIFRSPLTSGGDLPTMDAATLAY